MKKISYTFIALLIFSISSYAQKFTLVEGSLSAIKNEKKINLEMTYVNMGVGKFEKEEDYINQKKSDYNAKEPGRGDSWEKSWNADRKNRFRPSFIELFNKHSKGVMAGDNTEAKYTMIFNTIYTEPGYNVYVSRKNAHINAEITIVETANREKVIAKVNMFKSPGRTFGGYDYDSGTRIEESYAAAGKRLGAYIAGAK